MKKSRLLYINKGVMTEMGDNINKTYLVDQDDRPSFISHGHKVVPNGNYLIKPPFVYWSGVRAIKYPLRAKLTPKCFKAYLRLAFRFINYWTCFRTWTHIFCIMKGCTYHNVIESDWYDEWR